MTTVVEKKRCMRLSDRTKSSRQRGASLIEFCFTIPVLLLIAGSTVDLSRYMRFLQITTFVSQETAEQIYRQCSDITIYNPPDITTTSLRIDSFRTENAIISCVERVQQRAQQLLNTSLGRAAVSSKVFRWQISQTSPSCAPLSNSDVSVMSATANLSGMPSDPTINQAALGTAGVQLGIGGIYQTISPSGAQRLLVSLSTLCQKNRVATVEVAYDFEPIVKFLPHMMIKLNTDGSQRETTAL
jgi:hypothetical protein